MHLFNLTYSRERPMKAEIKSDAKSLYEEDFYLWLLKTAGQLKERRFQDVDWDNLIEEIECMGRSERRALKSFLIRLLEHILKLAYWHQERERNQNHWKEEIRNFRQEIQFLIEDSPSLNPYTDELFVSIYDDIAKDMKSNLGLNIPADCPFTLAQLLDSRWFPDVTEEYRED